MPVTAAYSELLNRLQRVQHLNSIAEMLAWDEQVNLPPGAAALRGSQHAALADVLHNALTEPRHETLLRSLAANLALLTDDQRIVLDWAWREFKRAKTLPASFVREKAELASRAFHVWVRARQDSDFEAFRPCLERQLELARTEAELLGFGDRPYDYFLDRHDPGTTTETVNRLFTELRAGLVPLVRRLLDSPVRPNLECLRGFTVASQQALVNDLVRRLGFDMSCGRLDVSVHPFCSGHGTDVRMTTRFDPDNPLDSLFSAIHETGHGLYEQGLPKEPAGTAFTEAAGMAVHESQSRLWENQVARSAAFWSFFEPRFRAAGPASLAQVSSEQLFLAVNAVGATPIRVDADETTYNLHILLRFDLERRLFSGELAVRDLPDAWAAASSELLGIAPNSDRLGVLQDVHWSAGAFGYFPSYCLGNMLAAQLWEQAHHTLPSLDADIAEGNFAGLLQWLRTEIHTHGRRHNLFALAKRVTGRELSAQPLLDYLKARYEPLYLK